MINSISVSVSLMAVASIVNTAAFTLKSTTNLHPMLSPFTSTFLRLSASYLDNLSSPPDSSDASGVSDTTSTTALQQPQQQLIQLLQLAAATGRGEFATPFQKTTAAAYIEALEATNPSPQPTTTSASCIQGTWELVYSDTQLFRSSPFFMAGRAVCQTPDQAKQYDWFCDLHRAALAISSIQTVRQIITETCLISEFEVKAGAVPFLRDFTPFSYSGGAPLTIDGAIVSTADITPINNGTAWELYMDTVQIKGSNVPGLRQLLDQGIKLESRGLASVLETTMSGLYTTPKPLFETTYLSDSIRISRDQDGKVFVYTKVSNSMEATNYVNVMPDFGVTRLLEGLNDAVTKFYL